MTKNHEIVRNKVGYRRWLHFRELADRARAHLSWRELSHRVGKDNAGWATKAYKYRSLVAESDVQTMEELVTELEDSLPMEEATMEASKKNGQPTAEERKERTRAWIKSLGDAGVPEERIAEAMGYHDFGNVKRLLNAPNMAPTQEAIEKLEERSEMLVKEIQAPRFEMAEEKPKKRRRDPGPTEVTVHQWNTAVDRTREKLVEAAMELEGAKEGFPGLFQDAIDSVVNRIMALAEELE